ncbi:MAG TPA: hypothetical protein PK432_00905 [Candidatus Dojkabacteria bacterium]|nr:hypothetical protein [Candidatus Dojkabacteria bacterium]HPP18722.1 hypothetical protein [Candidatus Dojkabacteria bacterium]
MFKEILFYILSLIFPSQKEQYTREYMINTKYLPVEVFWIDNTNVLLSSYGYTQLFNTENRDSSVIDTCEDCIYGYDKNFVYCKYINRDIKSKNEFSTTIEIFDINNQLLYSKDIFQTVAPVKCTRDSVLLHTNDPALEQHSYILDIKKDSLKEIKENIKDTKEWFNNDKTKKIIIGEDKRVWLFKS